MNWLPQSSDIKIIEYVWKTLRKKRPHKLQSSVTNVKSKQDLMNNVIVIWTSLSPAYIESLYNQLPERMRAFLEGNGCITKYRQEGHDGPEIAHLSLLTKHAPSSFPVT